MQQMRRRMVSADRTAAAMIDVKCQRSPRLERAFLDDAGMHEHIAEMFLSVGDLEAHPLAYEHAGVADLAAGFAVERRLVEHHGAVLAFFQRFDFLAVAHERGDDAFCAFGLVAKKLSTAEFFADAEPNRLVRRLAGACPRGTRLSALLVHLIVKTSNINGPTLASKNV